MGDHSISLVHYLTTDLWLSWFFDTLLGSKCDIITGKYLEIFGLGQQIKVNGDLSFMLEKILYCVIIASHCQVYFTKLLYFCCPKRFSLYIFPLSIYSSFWLLLISGNSFIFGPSQIIPDQANTCVCCGLVWLFYGEGIYTNHAILVTFLLASHQSLSELISTLSAWLMSASWPTLCGTVLFN